jgi:hypothetical protein
VADGGFTISVVEAQNLRLDISWCHRDRVLSNHVAQSLDDADGGAEIPGGPDPNIADRTSGSARPTATVGQSGLLRRSRSPASRTPTDHLAGGGVNRDASLSCRAPGSGVAAQHGEPSLAAGLVAPSGSTQTVTADPYRTLAGAIDLPTITTAADLHLAHKSRADTTPASSHRQTSRGRAPLLPRYSPRMRARHGVGHGAERNRQVQIGAVLAP